jgi:hypothetical protein
MYYGACRIHTIVAGKVPLRNLRGQSFQTVCEIRTMVYTGHAPQDNGFHDLHNGHVDFDQWLGQVDLRRPVHCAL